MHWTAVVNGRFGQHECLSWACIENQWPLESSILMPEDVAISYRVMHVWHRFMQLPL